MANFIIVETSCILNRDDKVHDPTNPLILEAKLGHHRLEEPSINLITSLLMLILRATSPLIPSVLHLR